MSYYIHTDWKGTLKNESKRMLKKVAVTSFEVQPWQFSVQTKEKHKNLPNPPFPGLDVNPLYPEYEAEGPYI
jgi:hypothetical protein